MININNAVYRKQSTGNQSVIRTYIDNLYSGVSAEYTDSQMLTIANYLVNVGDGDSLIEGERFVLHALEKIPNNNELKLIYARILNTLGRHEQAVAIVDELAQHKQSYLLIWAAFMNAQIHDEEHDERCFNYAQTLVERYPNDPNGVASILALGHRSIDLKLQYRLLDLALKNYKERNIYYSIIVNFYREGMRRLTHAAEREAHLAHAVQFFYTWYDDCDERISELPKADCNRVAKMYPSAIQVLEKHLKRYDNVKDRTKMQPLIYAARMMLAECCIAEGRCEQALNELQKYRDEFVPPEVADEHIERPTPYAMPRFDAYAPSFAFLKARALQKLERYQEAAELYADTEFYEDDYYHALLLVYQAQVYWAQGDHIMTENTLVRARGYLYMYHFYDVEQLFHRTSGDFYYDMSEERDHDEYIDMAREHYELCYDYDDDDLEAHLLYLQIALLQGRAQLAESLIAYLGVADVDVELIKNYRAALHIVKGDYGAAQRILMRGGKWLEKRVEFVKDIVPNMQPFYDFVESSKSEK